MAQLTESVSLDREGEVAVITVDNPSVKGSPMGWRKRWAVAPQRSC
jgi:hypothetical protein